MSEQTKTPPTLRPEVAEHYKCVKILPGEIVFKNRNYDLSKIDLATAKQLEADKCPYLEPKKPATPANNGSNKPQ